MRSNGLLFLTKTHFILCCFVAPALLAPMSLLAEASDIQWLTQPAEKASMAEAPLSVAAQVLELATRSDARRIVMQFDEPVTDQQRAALEEAGVTLLNYLSDDAFFATLHADRLDIDGLISAATIVQAEAIAPVVKLTPMLADELTPEWAVVNSGADEPPIIGAYVMFHRDVDLATEGIPLLEMYGANIRDVLTSINGLVVEAPLALMHDLATEDAIQWIEEALPPLSETNDSCRVIAQASNLQNSPYDLDGTGVTVLVYDGGTARSSHYDFGGRLSVHDGSGMSYHATHVSGTIGGDGTASGGQYRGMAPNVDMLSYGFDYDGSGTFLYTNPGDIEADYTSAIGMGAVIANNSIGTNTETNDFPCEYQGNYGATSNLIDSIVRGSVSGGEPFRIVWANGNERQGSRCDVEGYGDYYSIAPPAGAKNHIAVGAVESDNGLMTNFSSWGPMDDGRMRPDISAPGCQSSDDGGVTSCTSSSDNSYTTLCGTSMASPTVTGVAALLIQDFRVQFPSLPDPRNSLLKVLFAHTSTKIGHGGPDYQFGYGVVRAKDAVDFMREGAFDDDEISTGEVVEYFVNVSTSDEWVKVTLAWDDYPGTPNVNPTLVNDLDLRVYDASNNRYYPWTLDPETPSADPAQDSEDHVNNIEQVRVHNPTSGLWRVEVHGTNVPEGPQPFSICATPELTPSGVRIGFPNGVPTTLSPGVSEDFLVDVSAETESIIPGSAKLHFRYDGGVWIEQQLASQGGDLWLAELPPATCDADPEFYVSVQGSISGVVTSPAGGASDPLTAVVGESISLFADNFETDQGWTVENDPGLDDGPWERGDPVGGGDRGDPANDYDGSGRCYLTDNVDDNSDVDGGYTRLLSPTIDMSGGDAEFTFALWYTNDYGADPDNDLFHIHVSNNNGANWTLVETVGPQTPAGGWNVHNFMVGDYVTPTAQVKVRFEASDLNDGSVVEAGIDAVSVGGFSCSGTFDDCNENAILDSDDIASGRSADVNDNGVPDECESVGCFGDINFDGVINLGDLGELLAHYGMTSGAMFEHGDLDEDGDVDLSDLGALLSVYGQSCP